MREKKQEYDRLYAMHIHQIWMEDLDRFLTELDKYEQQEEKDRLAHTANAENKGKGGKGRKGVKPKGKVETGGKDKKKVTATGGGDGKKGVMKKKDAEMPPQEEDISELPLMERIKRAKASG